MMKTTKSKPKPILKKPNESAKKAKPIEKENSVPQKMPKKANNMNEFVKEIVKKPNFQDKLLQIKQSLAGNKQEKEIKNAIKIQKWYRRKLAKKRASKLNSNKMGIVKKAIPTQQFEYHDQEIITKSFNLFAGPINQAQKINNDDIKEILSERKNSESKIPENLQAKSEANLQPIIPEKSVRFEIPNEKSIKTPEKQDQVVENKNCEPKIDEQKQLEEFMKRINENQEKEPLKIISPSPIKSKDLINDIKNDNILEENSKNNIQIDFSTQKNEPEPIKNNENLEPIIKNEIIPIQENIKEPEKSNIKLENEPHFEKLTSYLDEIVSNDIEKPIQNTSSNMKNEISNIELNEAKNTIEVLKKALEQEKVKLKEQEKSFSMQNAEKLANQKKEYEIIIEKNISFIDQLVKDKKELTEHLENTKNRLKEAENLASKKSKEIESNFAAELKKNKEAWMAAEKIRKEKWEKEKTQEIKINTTKALQPELVNMMQKHQKQMKELEDTLEVKYKKERENYQFEFEQKMKELKEKNRKDLEEALENSRQEFDTKLKQQMDRMEREAESVKTRIKLEMQNEIERLEYQKKSEREKYEKEIIEVRRLADAKIDATKSYYEEKIEELNKKQKHESKKIKEETISENNAWRDELEKQKQTEIQKIAAELKRQMELQRKQEVEMVITKLGDENHEYKKTLEKDQFSKITEIEQNCQRKIDEMNKNVQEWIGKYKALEKTKEMLDGNLKVLMRNMEGMQKTVGEKEQKYLKLETEMLEYKEKLNGVDGEYKKMISELDSENRNKIINLEKEVSHLNSEVELSKKRLENEQNALKQKNAKELEIIEERVKKALGKKDENIKQLKDEIIGLNGQIEKYKELLAKQRQELLGK